MGIFRLGDINKEGKGVRKDAPEKRSFFAFFELFFRKIGRLCKLNLLYLLTSLPVTIIIFFLAGLISNPIIELCTPALASVLDMPAPDLTDAVFSMYIWIIDIFIRVLTAILFLALWGAGPVTAGFTYVLRNYAREEHAWLWSDFWQYTKENFKQTIAVIVIDIAVFGFAVFAYQFYGAMGGMMQYFRFVIIAGIFVYTIMHRYIYQMIITSKLSLRDIYRNAILFTFMKLPLNLLIIVLVAAIHFGIPYLGLRVASLGTQPIFWIAYVLLEILMLMSMSGFIVNFSIYPTIKKYMIDCSGNE